MSAYRPFSLCRGGTNTLEKFSAPPCNARPPIPSPPPDFGKKISVLAACVFSVWQRGKFTEIERNGTGNWHVSRKTADLALCLQPTTKMFNRKLKQTRFFLLFSNICRKLLQMQKWPISSLIFREPLYEFSLTSKHNFLFGKPSVRTTSVLCSLFFFQVAQ